MKKVLRIGTRDSQLALWQANTVKNFLESRGHTTQLVPVKSAGDLVLDKPLYELGITGIFTKSLDVALLKGEIDLAVHSLKDMPTSMPAGIQIAGILERGNPNDVLIHKGLDFLNEKGIIATGSLRRQAQWLHRYPLHEVVDLRGNVNTRLQKLQDHSWNAAIFAAAGLERLELSPENLSVLHWMVPAPGQGAMAVTVLESEPEVIKAVAALNDASTALCTSVEREFLKELEGGCSAPIGALARKEGDQLHFKGILLSEDGQHKVEVNKSIMANKAEHLGLECAREIRSRGGDKIMQNIRNNPAG